MDDSKMFPMNLKTFLLEGQAIPALPLALDCNRRFSERHERALVRYYLAAGCGGLAVGVHSTQFEIREPRHGLFEPVLELASLTIDEELALRPRPFCKIAGICGHTPQAVAETGLAKSLGYHAGLLSLAAWKSEPDQEILAHCRAVAEVLPIIGFYLQAAVGGRRFSEEFWRQFMEIENVVGVKIAPFNRFQTLDVVRAATESGRVDIALYTGNDDNIVVDLLTPFRFHVDGQLVERRIVGGLLGHWGVWSRSAVELFARIKEVRRAGKIDSEWLSVAAAVTEMNAAVFDPSHGFSGCIPGILEVLRMQGLVPTHLCLNPEEQLSPGQADEIRRVAKAHPSLVDDAFVLENLCLWLD